MDIHSQLRQIAKSDTWQHLFSLSKEINGLSFFENSTNFTEIQMTFLRYLSFYSNLYTDVVLGDVTDRVFDNFIYEDSYMLWKNKQDKKTKKSRPQDEYTTGKTSRWVFKQPKSE